MRMSKQWLIDNNACEDGIKFAIKQKLIDMPIDLIRDGIRGYGTYINWLNDAIKSEILYDNYGRMIQRYIPVNHFSSQPTILYYFYDDNSNIINIKYEFKTYEKFFEYDTNNNLIHEFDSNDYHYWYKYDKNNNLIYEKNSTGRVFKYTYDDNNNRIQFYNSYGYTISHQYDNNNNIIFTKRSCSIEGISTTNSAYSYDDRNNKILEVTESGKKNIFKYEYYPDGQLKEYVENNNNIFIPYFNK